MKLPKWVCETHLREIEDLVESGCKSEAREVWESSGWNWARWCEDCSTLLAQNKSKTIGAK